MGRKKQSDPDRISADVENPVKKSRRPRKTTNGVEPETNIPQTSSETVSQSDQITNMVVGTPYRSTGSIWNEGGSYTLTGELAWFVSAEELRQFFYCPRIVVFRHLRKIRPPTSYAMDKGTAYHDTVIYSPRNSQHHPHRRSKKSTGSPGLTSSIPIDIPALLREIAPVARGTEQYHDMYIESPEYHLLGRLDMVEKRGEEIYPVEIKTGPEPPATRQKHHSIQLTVQALLLEDVFDCMIQRGRIVYLGSRTNRWIEISIEMKQQVLRAVRQIRKLYESEILPNPTLHVGKCEACEYKRVCNRM
jgi:CRISPR-associated exonuclease Cas4